MSRTPPTGDRAARWTKLWCSHLWADSPHGPVVTRFDLQALRDLAGMMRTGPGPEAVVMLCTTKAVLAWQRGPSRRDDPFEYHACPFTQKGLFAMVVSVAHKDRPGVCQAVATAALAKVTGRSAAEYGVATAALYGGERPSGARLN